jgi:hypothetical protein
MSDDNRIEGQAARGGGMTEQSPLRARQQTPNHTGRRSEVRASLYAAGVPVERLDAAVDAVMRLNAARDAS